MIWWFGPENYKIEFDRGQNPIMPSLILPKFPKIFTTPKCIFNGTVPLQTLQYQRSLTNMTVNTSHDAPRRPVEVPCVST